MYLRQANKRRVRSTPFHHVDGPLFSFMMWNSTLISDGFLLLPYKCCHLKFFFICVRLFIIVPCFLHLSIFLVFIIDLPISPHRLFSLVTSDQIFFTHFLCLQLMQLILLWLWSKCVAFYWDRLGWPAKCFCSNDSFLFVIFFPQSIRALQSVCSHKNWTRLLNFWSYYFIFVICIYRTRNCC